MSPVAAKGKGNENLGEQEERAGNFKPFHFDKYRQIELVSFRTQKGLWSDF